MKSFLKIIFYLVLGIIALVIFTIGIFYIKYTIFDKEVQLLYASEIDTERLIAPDFPEKLIEFPNIEGNAADHYIQAKNLLEKNHKFLNSLRENRFLLDNPEKSPNDIKIDQGVLSELLKATSIKECRFVPKFLSIPDDPDKPWPNPPTILLSLPYVLIAVGNKALKEANYDYAEEMYGRVIIMGSHITHERLTQMFVTLGYLIQRQGCRHLLDAYWKRCNPTKGKLVELYINQTISFGRQLSDKALVIGGVKYRSGIIPFQIPNHIEIVKKVLLKDEDPMFRVEAALELRKLKLLRIFYFESKVAQNALNDATNDPDPQVRNAVLYAQKYDRDDLNRENETLFNASKEILKKLISDPKSKWIVDIMKKDDNPHMKEVIEEALEESKEGNKN